MLTIYIYNRNNLSEDPIQRPALSKENFYADILLHFPDYDELKHVFSEVKLNYPTLDADGKLREKTGYELAKEGILKLAEGQYLDDTQKVIVTIEKPNSYSKWNNNTHKWEEIKEEKLEFLKTERYHKQQKFLADKKQLATLQEEKEEFEELGFPTDETDDRIEKITKEMDVLKKEIAALTKEIKELEK